MRVSAMNYQSELQPAMSKLSHSLSKRPHKSEIEQPTGLAFEKIVGKITRHSHCSSCFSEVRDS